MQDKAKGVYTGRKATIDTEAIRKMKAEGSGATAIAKAFGSDDRTLPPHSA